MRGAHDYPVSCMACDVDRSLYRSLRRDRLSGNTSGMQLRGNRICAGAGERGSPAFCEVAPAKLHSFP